MESKLKIVLSYLPLLRANTLNKSSLRYVYYELIGDIFAHAIKSHAGLWFDCYQLALLAHLHPVFERKQRALLKKWLGLFETKVLAENRKSELLATKIFKNDDFGGYKHKIRFFFYIYYLNFEKHFERLINSPDSQGFIMPFFDSGNNTPPSSSSNYFDSFQSQLGILNSNNSGSPGSKAGSVVKSPYHFNDVANELDKARLMRSSFSVPSSLSTLNNNNKNEGGGNSCFCQCNTILRAS